MGFAEKRGSYWRARYKTAPGKHLTVVDEQGKTIKFATKGEAQRSASEGENKYRRGDWRDPALGQETFGEYASRWYEAQDLAASTMQNYKRHIEEHLLPDFEDHALAGILRSDVDRWEKKERALYAASSVKTWRSTFHLIFEDAIDEGLITSNPATRRRGRGKRAGRSRDRGPEKVRSASCSPPNGQPCCPAATTSSSPWCSRDTPACAGAKSSAWRQSSFAPDPSVSSGSFTSSTRVRWCAARPRTTAIAPSTRWTGCPPWSPTTSPARSRHLAPATAGPTSSVAKARLVPEGTRARSSSTSHAGLRSPRERCPTSSTTLTASPTPPAHGWRGPSTTSGSCVAEHAAHWRRNGFGTWLFTPAVSGWYPKKAPQEARPVPLLGEPWPGVPVRGRGAGNRADACWLPVAKGLTPHGLRHTHRTVMEDLGTEKVLMDQRMGHIDGSVSARYAHVTPGMRKRLVAGMTEQWEATLDARLALCPTSPVRVLNDLLRACAVCIR